jgi:hypothetical protein
MLRSRVNKTFITYQNENLNVNISTQNDEMGTDFLT